MYPDKLYQLAFAFRKTKLWKSLYESELFAVALPDGEIGYCCVMGSGGEHLALALYVGNNGLDTFRIMQEAGDAEEHPLKAYETMLSQDCLQCSFESKDMLSPEELSAVRAYASEHQLNIPALLLSALDLDPAPLAAPFDSPNSINHVYRSISKIKCSLSQFPRNPLNWCELARQYLILGQSKQSEHALQVAHSLSPDHRIVLRAIAHFYSHIRQTKTGHPTHYVRTFWDHLLQELCGFPLFALSSISVACRLASWV